MRAALHVDAELLSGVLTAVLLVIFLGIWRWAFSARRRAAYDAAAQLPLEEDEQDPRDVREGHSP